MNREVLESKLKIIFDNYEDKESLSFKVVKQTYNKDNNEMNKDEAKMAKVILMDLYKDYVALKENNAPSIGENNSKKRVRADSVEETKEQSENGNNDHSGNTSIYKPEGKKQKFEEAEDSEKKNEKTATPAKTREPLRDINNPETEKKFLIKSESETEDQPMPEDNEKVKTKKSKKIELKSENIQATKKALKMTESIKSKDVEDTKSDEELSEKEVSENEDASMADSEEDKPQKKVSGKSTKKKTKVESDDDEKESSKKVTTSKKLSTKSIIKSTSKKSKKQESDEELSEKEVSENEDASMADSEEDKPQKKVSGKSTKKMISEKTTKKKTKVELDDDEEDSSDSDGENEKVESDDKKIKAKSKKVNTKKLATPSKKPSKKSTSKTSKMPESNKDLIDKEDEDSSSVSGSDEDTKKTKKSLIKTDDDDDEMSMTKADKSNKKLEESIDSDMGELSPSEMAVQRDPKKATSKVIRKPAKKNKPSLAIEEEVVSENDEDVIKREVNRDLTATDEVFERNTLDDIIDVVVAKEENDSDDIQISEAESIEEKQTKAPKKSKSKKKPSTASKPKAGISDKSDLEISINENEDEQDAGKTDYKVNTDPKIQRFRKLLRMAGLWGESMIKNSELEAMKSKKARYEHLVSLFTNAGFTKQITKENCKKFKEKLDRKKEIAELDMGNIIETSSTKRSTRGSLRNQRIETPAKTKLNMSGLKDSDSEESNSDQEEAYDPLANMKDLVNSGESSSEETKPKRKAKKSAIATSSDEE